MCSNLKLLDSINIQSRVVVKNALISSTDSRYCIISEEGLYCLHLCGMMDNILKAISFKKLFIKIPEYVTSSNLNIDLSSFINYLPQHELYETVLNLHVSEELNKASFVKQQPVQAKWSPMGLVDNGHCALAAITNTGTLNIFLRAYDEVEYEDFIMVVNVSQLCINYFKVKRCWKTVACDVPSDKLVELKIRVMEVTPSTFEWSGLFKIENDTFSLLFVGHLNGGITTWKFNKWDSNCLSKSDENCMGNFITSLKRITALLWQQAGQDGLLIAGDIEGKVVMVPITNITTNSVTFGSQTYLWESADDITVDFVKIVVHNGKLFVFIVKSSFLITCLIDENGKVLDVQDFNAGNYNITALEHFDDNTFLLLTHKGVLKELKVSCDSNKIKTEWRVIYIDYSWSACHTYGLIVSPNRVFITILINQMERKDKKLKDSIRLLIFMNTNKDPLNILMQNNSDSLANYWDCLEILRLDGLTEKKLPCDGLPVGLDYDKLSLIQLKTCLWLARASEIMYSKMYTIEDYNILRYDEFKQIVKIKLSIEHMHHLLEYIADGVELSEFHWQSLDILNMYLKEIIVGDAIPKLGLGRSTIDGLFDVVTAANELEYPAPPQCLWCKESIIGLHCVPSHIDTRCMLSFMPVTNLPYYKCKFCEGIMHSKLLEVYPLLLCPYCDIPLDLIDILKTESNIERMNLEDGLLDTCSLDCLRETIDENDVEDHAFTEVTSTGGFVDIMQDSSNSDTESRGDGTSSEPMEIKTE